MFIVVIVAHLVAVLFSFCGVVQVGAFISGPTYSSAGAFASALSIAAWPIAVAVAVEILIQIACMLEKLLISRASVASVDAMPKKSKAQTAAKQQREQTSEAGMFFRADRLPEQPVAPVVEEPIAEEPKVEEKAAVQPEEKVAEPEKKVPALNFFRVD